MALRLPPPLQALHLEDLRRQLENPGIRIDLGACTVQISADVPSLTEQIQAVYGHFPVENSDSVADIHVRLFQVTGFRRWLRPQINFECDGVVPFDPFPADTGLPMLEWGVNWYIGRRLNHWLLLHAGALARPEGALLLPALPGSGKSTLTAALACRHWRLLSDEFGAVNRKTQQIHPLLKPPALKNESIAIIQHWAPDATLGPVFPETRKGRVAHLAPDTRAVAGRQIAVPPRLIVFPEWRAKAPVQIHPIAPEDTFRRVAFNAFNYEVCGKSGFESVVHMARNCPAFSMIYSQLDDAEKALDALWADVTQGQIA